eukprot:scpid87969/ scgid26799/ 
MELVTFRQGLALVLVLAFSQCCLVSTKCHNPSPRIRRFCAHSNNRHHCRNIKFCKNTTNESVDNVIAAHNATDENDTIAIASSQQQNVSPTRGSPLPTIPSPTTGCRHRRCRLVKGDYKVKFGQCTFDVALRRCAGKCCSETRPVVVPESISTNQLSIGDFFTARGACCKATQTSHFTVTRECKGAEITVRLTEAKACQCS